MSEKRISMLHEDPGLLVDVLELRGEGRVPGLLNLDRAWDALDVMLGRGKNPVLGDAVLARTGRHFGPELTFGRGRLLAVQRVRRVNDELEQLPSNLVEEMYPLLRGLEVHGGFGRPSTAPPSEYADLLEGMEDPEEVAEREVLSTAVVGLRKLYREASRTGKAVYSVVF